MPFAVLFILTKETVAFLEFAVYKNIVVFLIPRFIKNKKVVIDFRYQSIDYSGVGHLFIVTRNSKVGVYNCSGEKILAVKYNEVDIHDTYIQTKLNNETAYYNLLGHRVDKSTIEELKEKK